MVWPFTSRKAAPPVEAKATDDSTSFWPFTDWIIPSSSGVEITADVAMKCSPVNAAVMLPADSTRTLSCSLLKEGDDGSKVPAKDHPAFGLVHDFANDWASAGEIRRNATIDAILHGDGFAYVSKTGGKPSEIIYLPRSVVSIEWSQFGEPTYSVNGEKYGPGEILHVGCPNWNNAPAQRGLGLLHNARDAIGLAILLERAAARLFKNGARPGGVISFEGTLTPAAATRAAASWKSAHGGDNNGGTAVLDNGAKYSQVAFTSVDSQHEEMRQFAIAEISRFTRVPVTMLGDLSKGTYANVEQQNLQFLQLCLMPWLKAWTDAYSRALLTPEERSQYCFSFDLEELLRADTAARATAFGQYRSAGVMTANDVRRKLNLPPLPDGNVLQSPHVQSPANDNQPPKDIAA